MSQLLSAFGIDWRLLLINGINFVVLLLALRYFLYGPLTTMLEARRAKVEQGVRDAEAAARSLEEIAASRAEKLAAAGREADELLAQARLAATQRGAEVRAAAEAAAARAVSEGQAQAKALKEAAIAESREEVAKLVVLGIEKMGGLAKR